MKERFRFRHIGINAASPKEAERIAKVFGRLLEQEVRKLPASYLVGNAIEVMCEDSVGKNGHIAFTVENADEAIAFLEAQDMTLANPADKTLFDKKKKPIYLLDEIGGFAIHLFEP